MEFKKLIKAHNFFPIFCPNIKNWNHKMRGADGNGNPIDFTPQEIKLIKIGIGKMAKTKLKL